MKKWALALGLTALAAVPASACQPIIQLMALYGGSTALAFLATKNSALTLWEVLGTAVVIKCVAFVWFARRLTPWYKAFCLMVAANIVSTFTGILAIGFSSGLLLLVAIPGVFCLSLLPARRYSRWLSEQFHRPISPSAVAGTATLLFIASIVLFFVSQGLAEHAPAGLYWLIKVCYIYCGLLVSIGFTIYVEEGTIAFLVKKVPGSETPYLPAVARANLVLFLLITLVGAILMLPERLASPHFLIEGP